MTFISYQGDWHKFKFPFHLDVSFFSRSMMGLFRQRKSVIFNKSSLAKDSQSSILLYVMQRHLLREKIKLGKCICCNNCELL